MSKEILETLQKDIAGLTSTVQDRLVKCESEGKELADKLAGVLKEQDTRKHQFEASGQGLSVGAAEKRELEMKMDELYIASVLLTDRKTGVMDKAKFADIQKAGEYSQAVDRIKATGFDFGGMDSTVNASSGEAIIPPGFSQTLLEDIFLTLKVANLFGRFTLPSPNYTWGIMTDRFAARLTAEKAAPTKEDLAAGNIVFAAKKLMATIDYTDELGADSIAALLPYMRKRLVESFGLAQEQVVLNGATDSLVFNGEADTEHATYLTNGVRKLAAAENVDFAGAFTETLLHSLRAKMGIYGVDPSKLSYVMSLTDYLKCLAPGAFPNYQALNTYGAGAIVLKGELARIAGIPIVVTELLPTNLGATGVYDAVGTKRTCGLIHTDSYMFGDLKSFGLETFRNPYNQFTSLIGSERLDFKKMTSAGATTAAFGINY